MIRLIELRCLFAVSIGVVASFAVDVSRLESWPRDSLSGLWVLSTLPTAPFVLWLAFGGALWLVDLGQRASVIQPASPPRRSGRTCFLICLAVGFFVPAAFGWRVRDLPPLYHDEYSYLFQVETFAAGKLYYPTPKFAPLFQQMHVLTEPVFASRFFPGTALWLLPFQLLATPLVAMWLASGLQAGFLALTARRWTPAAGYIAGLLSATSPAMLAFDNLLLSPGVTMLFISIFLWAYFHLIESGRATWGCIAGGAIGCAFLCRPLTAAGLGLPFAAYAILRQWRDGATYARGIVALVGVFSTAIIGLALYDAAITGSPWQTPYGLYTAEYSPSHCFGFFNRQRGMAARGPKTLVAYDNWAEELTPRTSFQMVGRRWSSFAEWVVYRPVLFSLGLMALVLLSRIGDSMLLLVLGVLGLTVAYLPFAFVGLLGFSYLVEAAPLIFLLLAAATGYVWELERRKGRNSLAWWWVLLPALGMVLSLYRDAPRIFAPGSELVYPRIVAARRADWERSASRHGPILVLVQADANDSNVMHYTFVHNRPTLDGPVVRAWQRGDWRELAATYPEREVYQWSATGAQQPIVPGRRNR